MVWVKFRVEILEGGGGVTSTEICLQMLVYATEKLPQLIKWEET